VLKEKEIPLGTELVNIFGVNDQNLNFLKSQFPNSKINLRGNIVYLEGSKEDIQNATSIIDELLIMSSQNKKIDVEDLELMLNFQTNKESLDQKNNYISVYQDKIIKLKNLSQFKYIENINKSVVTFGIGPAGTGKTFLAVASAVKLYDEEKVKKIVLTRPAVEAGERLGYLPGDLSQKIDPYLVPLFDSLEYFFGNENLQYLIEKRVIEIVPLAYMRGRTLSNACIILDEAQNATVSQIKMFLTRIGDESKIIITGDESQVDLQNKEFSGLKKVRKSLSNIEEISISLFENKDIVRNKIVSKILEVFPEK
jgi:phosphate starvation-inducible PhoH-like protein|tara:strand:+ start:1940 stop:2872 length:933 start_codon:yes stop_codon:yes gene_type:complete